MQKKKIIISIVVVLAIIAIAIYAIVDTPNQLEMIQSEDALQSPEVLATKATERQWVDDFVGEEQVLKPAITDSIYRGGIIKHIGNHLYIADFNDMRLKRFNIDGSYAGAFGKGNGRGPGELLALIDFDIAKNGYLYMVDTYRREIMKFDCETTDYLTSYSIKYQPYRMIGLGDYLLVEGLNQQNLFTIHNSNGNIEDEFGTILKDQVQNFMSLSGEIDSYKNGDRFIFVPTAASYLFYFDKEGNRTKTIQTIDKIPFKESIERTKGNTKTIRPPRSLVETYDIHIFGDKLYLSQLRTNEKETSLPPSFLDAYDIESGSYLYSVELPLKTNDVVFTKDLMYLLTIDTELVKAYTYNEK